MHIAIAGNIGSGKTTLTTKLAKHYKWEAHYEDVENNPYLNDFYKDMQRWSFNLQVFFLNSRFRQIVDIKKLVNEFSDFARMPRPIFKKIFIDDVINRVISFYNMSEKNLDLSLKNNLKTNFSINGDSEQLYRAFLNLIKYYLHLIKLVVFRGYASSF